MDDLIGRKFGPYTLVEKVGEGGMAEVYKGYQESLNRYVAIKVLRGELAHDQEFITRFRREALAVAKLNHPNILHVYDAGVVDGIYYIVMDYVEGGSLKDVIQRGPISPQRAVAWTIQLAEALDYAHRHGLIHRDVKPSNILLTGDGRPMLTDFGIAKVLHGDSHLTRTGAAIGTPEYMAPEQFQGQSVDGRADIYSLGIVLFEMLVGWSPFHAPTPMATMYKQMNEPPPPLRQMNITTPEWLGAVVDKALVKDPEERYQRAGEMAEALRQQGAPATAERAARRGTPTPAPEATRPAVVEQPAGKRRKKSAAPILIGVIAVLLLALVAAGAYLFLGQGPQTPTPIVVVVTTEPTATPVLPTPTPISAGATRPRDKDGMIEVYVPPGEFQMGSTDAEVDDALALCNMYLETCERSGFEQEQPAHTVALAGFWLDRTEVSNAQFRQCVEAGACQAPTTCKWGEPTYEDETRADHPVVCADWEQARAYCAWAGGRLPTEAEWEYAAQGQDSKLFPWGNIVDQRANYCDLNCEFDWADGAVDDGYDRTAPADSFPNGASWVGALNLGGNVWEWVADWYGDYPDKRVENPLGPASGKKRVLRGGSWVNPPSYLRGTNRGSIGPGSLNSSIGFRCARDAQTAP